MSGSEVHNLRRLRKQANFAQRGLCYWCQREMNNIAGHPRQLTGDHLIPFHAGGQTVAGNIVAACKKCNNERHPELNRSNARRNAVNYSAGDPGRTSPFDVLAPLIAATNTG